MRRTIISLVLFLLALASVDSQPPSPRPTVQYRGLENFNPPTPSVSPRETPTLRVSPSPPIEVGQRVEFEVVPKQPTTPAIQYRFNFGDGVISDWTSEPSIPYTYRYPSHPEYQTSLQIRRDGRVLPQVFYGPLVHVVAQSSPTQPSTATSVPITPAPPSSLPGNTATRGRPPPPTHTPGTRTRGRPSPDPLLYVVGIGLVVLVIGYLLRPKPKPIRPPIVVMFHPHSDWDAPQKSQNNVRISYELLFDPNISNGRDRLETNGANLILRKKKQ